MLPTTTTEYFNSLKLQLYNEEIKNNLLNVFFINLILNNIAPDQDLVKNADGAVNGLAPKSSIARDVAHIVHSNNKEVNYLKVFCYIQNLLEEYTKNDIKLVKKNSGDLLTKAAARRRRRSADSSQADSNKKLVNLEVIKKLVNEIIYDLYDEFKYGEALGLINKVVYKDVKKLVTESKRVIRKRGINDFIIPWI